MPKRRVILRTDKSQSANVERHRKEQKVFDLSRVRIDGDQQALRVICPQTRCGNWFVVPLHWARFPKGTDQHLRTRPCPHCFYTARIPKLPKRRVI